MIEKQKLIDALSEAFKAESEPYGYYMEDRFEGSVSATIDGHLSLDRLAERVIAILEP